MTETPLTEVIVGIDAAPTHYGIAVMDFRRSDCLDFASWDAPEDLRGKGRAVRKRRLEVGELNIRTELERLRETFMISGIAIEDTYVGHDIDRATVRDLSDLHGRVVATARSFGRVYLIAAATWQQKHLSLPPNASRAQVKAWSRRVAEPLVPPRLRKFVSEDVCDAVHLACVCRGEVITERRVALGAAQRAARRAG